MMIARGQQLLMADADGATKISDLVKLEDALKQLTTPGTILAEVTWLYSVCSLALAKSMCF